MSRLRLAALRDVRGLLSSPAYERRTTWRGRPVRLSNRGPGARMGRHGGGWDFEVGIQLGSRGLDGTVLIKTGRGSIRIDPRRDA